MYLNILYLHIIFASIFTIYILIDRIYIRNFIVKDKRETFYKNSRVYLLLIALILLLSGFYLLLNITFTLFVFFKVLSALFLLYGFFNCPFYMKKQNCEIRKFMYRFGVLIMLIITVLLGVYI